MDFKAIAKELLLRAGLGTQADDELALLNNLSPHLIEGLQKLHEITDGAFKCYPAKDLKYASAIQIKTNIPASNASQDEFIHIFVQYDKNNPQDFQCIRIGSVKENKLVSTDDIQDHSRFRGFTGVDSISDTPTAYSQAEGTRKAWEYLFVLTYDNNFITPEIAAKLTGKAESKPVLG